MSALGQTLNPALQRLGEVSVRLSVELGRTQMALKDVLALAEGSVVSLDKLTDELLDITANGQVIAHGEVIAEDGKFALRIVSLAGGDDISAPAPSTRPRPDVPPPPPPEPEPETTSPQPPVEPTSDVTPEPEENVAPPEPAEEEPVAEAADDEPEVDALLDALDELTDAPAEDGADAADPDEEI